MTLGVEISKTLFKAEPKLLDCDLDASARAAVALSSVLGCVMATVLRKQGQIEYERAMKAVFEEVHKSAVSVVTKSLATRTETTQ